MTQARKVVRTALIMLKVESLGDRLLVDGCPVDADDLGHHKTFELDPSHVSNFLYHRQGFGGSRYQVSVIGGTATEFTEVTDA